MNMTAGTMSTSVAGGHFAMGPSVGSTYAVFNIAGAALPSLIAPGLTDRANSGILFNVTRRAALRPT